MVRVAGFEPATSCTQGMRPNQTGLYTDFQTTKKNVNF